MPVDTPHPDYQASLLSWQTMQDVLSGEEQVKAAGERYLPMLIEQDTEDYERMRQRGSFFNATGRTQMALLGFLFRKDPQITPDEEELATQPKLAEFVEDATMTGKSLEDAAKDLVADGVTAFGRCLTTIDWDETEQRPFILFYAAPDILNWRYQRVNGKMRLTQLILFERDETYYDIGDGEKPADGYERVFYDQWREWELKSDDAGGYYVEVTVWRRKKGHNSKEAEAQQISLLGTGPNEATSSGNSHEFVPIASYQPKRGLVALQDIPVVFHGTQGTDGSVITRPPLLDMANINLSHYRTSVDYENVLHVLGIPTAWAAGFTDDDEADDLVLGLQSAWVSSNPAAKCGFLELTGAGVKNLTDALDRKEKHMAALGARMLDNQHASRQPEAFATVALRQTGETAVLSALSVSMTQSMTDVMAWAYWWLNRNVKDAEEAENSVAFILTTDFLETTLDAQTITALMAAYLQGGMSYDSLFFKLQQGEVIPGDRKLNEEKKLIEEGKGALMAIGAIPNPEQDIAMEKAKAEAAAAGTVVSPEGKQTTPGKKVKKKAAAPGI